MNKKKIAIIGATGFTGSELVRILHYHPKIDISCITSESKAGDSFSSVHPFFKGIVDKTLTSVKDINKQVIDLAFLALPHGVSMEFAEQFQKSNIPVIDLSGDFRLSSPEVYEAWYHKEHQYPQGFEKAVYGLPELNFNKIQSAQIIANPGCYPTSVVLAIAPLLQAGLVDPSSIIADSKSGITGAGVKSKPLNHFARVNDNFNAYGLKNHRHSIEIQEKLQEISSSEVIVQFTPHLLPVDRGILSTIYLKPLKKDFREEDLKKTFESFYKQKRFIRLLSFMPSIKNVRGTNYCDIYYTFDARTGNIIVISAIDNLVKGAAGQAVQNMNILFNWEEELGLDQIPLCP